jgi:hypothetical protein
VLIGALCGLLAAVVLSEAATAVVPGVNGRIVFASGRGEANDSTARLFFRTVTSDTGGGSAGPTVTPSPPAPAGVQHRHPTWSPDRTKIAYARGDNNCSAATTTNCAIYILDVTDPNATPQPMTNVDNVADDRPAWSPDGNFIAYESEVTNGNTTKDIVVENVELGSAINITASADDEGKPTWTPDSQTLYYARDIAGGGVDNDIVSEPATGGTVTPVITGATDDYQPALSADGTKLCFTRGPFGSNDAEIFTASANGSGAAAFSFDDNVGSYNCTWAPENNLVAYVDGVFSGGELVIQEDPAPLGFPIPIETTAARFDGNPDWAPDGRPQCEDQTITTLVNQPVQVPLLCEDKGPAYELSQVTGIRDTLPTNGTISPEDAQQLPANLTYTPNQNFTGTDSFKIQSFDQFGFGDRDGTVTINVRKQANTFKVVKVKRNKRKGTAVLTVRVDEAPGQLTLAASKKVKGDAERVNGPTAELLVKPKGKAKRKLKQKGKVKIKAAITYDPELGDPGTQNEKVGLKRRR